MIGKIKAIRPPLDFALGALRTSVTFGKLFLPNHLNHNGLRGDSTAWESGKGGFPIGEYTARGNNMSGVLLGCIISSIQHCSPSMILYNVHV